MTIIWKGLQVTFGFFLIAGLLFASAVFGVLLYGKITGQPWIYDGSVIAHAEDVKAGTGSALGTGQTPAVPAQAAAVKQTSAMLDAPMIRQKPELPSGCEITSLTMLLQHYGVQKTKMELVPEMKRDNTPIRYNADGTIAYWGNPNLGFVGEITGSAKGFGIYHSALFELLKAYVPTAADLTRQPFEKLEDQLLKGIPSVVWTTIDYQVPDRWVIWDTSIGPIQTTFMEHAVLLVGFDEQNVYVNDPLSGRSKQKIDKAQFIATWEAMGKQALSYTKAAK